MKKSFILALTITVALAALSVAGVYAAGNSAEISEAIAKYKQKNYIGCISDMQQLTEKDPSVAICAFASAGRLLTRRPPRSGSMIMTGIPFSAAYVSPDLPAWECSSR